MSRLAGRKLILSRFLDEVWSGGDVDACDRFIAGQYAVPSGPAVRRARISSRPPISAPRGTPIHVYHGSKDDIAPIAHSGLYACAIPTAVVHRLEGRNHQLDDDLAEVAAGVRTLA